MKKGIAIGLCVVTLLFCLAGCGKAKADRILYKSDLSKAVKLGNYKGLSIDRSSDQWKEAYDAEIASDAQNNGFYVQKTEGTVAEGDTVNIDYEGKKDGVAFDGGTDQGHDLEIGSHSFIDGFEEGLIGKEIGSTVDLDLTFPEEYPNNPELAGAAVVFTVTINYVVTDEPLPPEEYYSKLDFATVGDYNQDVAERTAKDLLLDSVKGDSEIKEYPQEDEEIIYAAYKTMMEQNLQNSYNIDFETYLGYVDQDEAAFKADLLESDIHPEMDTQMVLYSILDKEKLSLTEEDIQAELDQMIAMYDNAGVTAELLKSYFGDFYFEAAAVRSKVLDFLYKSAKVSG